MSTIAFFLRNNITDDHYEQDKSGIEKALHEAGFTFNTSEQKNVMCWHVYGGSSYTDEDGEECFRSFNINLVRHIASDRIEYIEGAPYIKDIYFDCLRGDTDINGDHVRDSWDLLLMFLHRYFESFPYGYLGTDSYYPKEYIDEKYENGNWDNWC